MLAISRDLEIGGDRVDELDPASCFEPNHLHDLGDEAVQRKPRQFWRIIDGPAIGQRRLTETDRAVERGDELGREPLDERIVGIREAIGQELRRGQHIAHVVIDLGNREPERSQMFFLFQLADQDVLHDGEFLFGISNLVIAAGRNDDAAGGTLGIGAEFDQTVGKPPHRAKHHEVNRDGCEVRDDHRHDKGNR